MGRLLDVLAAAFVILLTAVITGGLVGYVLYVLAKLAEAEI